jgi:hypothetical protein
MRRLQAWILAASEAALLPLGYAYHQRVLSGQTQLAEFRKLP